MKAHLQFPAEHAETIEAAGPLTSTDGNPARGIWILKSRSADAARRLVEADPFYATELHKSVRILNWRQVFADGRALV